MPAIAVIGSVIGAVGTGLSYAANMSAANTAQQFSALNAQAGAQQATQQASIAAAQAQLQATQAGVQQRAAFDNAQAMREQTDAEGRIAQENIRRGRDEFSRQLAQAAASQGGSGVTLATGSPLDLLVNAASIEQQQEQDAQWQANAGRVAGYRQAANTALQGEVAGINASLYELESLSAIQEGRTKADQAKLGGFAGAAQAQGMRSSALGGFIGGVGSNLTSFANTPWARKKWGL